MIYGQLPPIQDCKYTVLLDSNEVRVETRARSDLAMTAGNAGQETAKHEPDHDPVGIMCTVIPYCKLYVTCGRNTAGFFLLVFHCISRLQ
jgi:hypothetical protein